MATDTRVAESERLAVVQVLGRESAEREADLSVLAKLLVPQNPVALQSAACDGLGRIPDDRVASVLIAGWRGYTPTLKSQVLDLLLSRDAWQRPLLRGIEKSEVPAAQIDAKHRQRLLAHKDERVRTQAAKLFTGAASPDREKVLQDYREVASMSGDRTRGKAVFAKTCAVCHRLQDVGNEVGPDLAALSNKTPLYLLTEILAPTKTSIHGTSSTWPSPRPDVLSLASWRAKPRQALRSRARRERNWCSCVANWRSSRALENR